MLLGLVLTPCRAQSPAPADAPVAATASTDASKVEVATRGPIHEAFAGVITYNPEAGVIAPKAPPAQIEELPPDTRPEGKNVSWIPGYWAWDDERNDFIWVSGIWRTLPPNREWIGGYWTRVSNGYQWISGYWGDIATDETAYLPPPPASVENGANSDPPSADHVWAPGSWIWIDEHYAWTAGYWARCRPNWVWIPSYYVWTPRGYIFVSGYWDYAVAQRGLLFAPVYFTSGYGYGYRYSPWLTVDLTLLFENLFLRPYYHHYYFGDYYGSAYYRGGYFPAYRYADHRRGYDPLFTHQRWLHRSDRNWHSHIESVYQTRSRDPQTRPPRTWDAIKALNASDPSNQDKRLAITKPLDQLARRNDSPIRLRAVAAADRQTSLEHRQQVQQLQNDRRRIESPSGERTAALTKPQQLRLPKSSIAARTTAGMSEESTPPPSPRSFRAPTFAPSTDRIARGNAREPIAESTTPGGSGRPGESGPRDKDPTSRRGTAGPEIQRGVPSRGTDPGRARPLPPAVRGEAPETRRPTPEATRPMRPQGVTPPEIRRNVEPPPRVIAPDSRHNPEPAPRIQQTRPDSPQRAEPPTIRRSPESSQTRGANEARDPRKTKKDPL